MVLVLNYKTSKKIVLGYIHTYHICCRIYCHCSIQLNRNDFQSNWCLQKICHVWLSPKSPSGLITFWSIQRSSFAQYWLIDDLLFIWFSYHLYILATIVNKNSRQFEVLWILLALLACKKHVMISIISVYLLYISKYTRWGWGCWGRVDLEQTRWISWTFSTVTIVYFYRNSVKILS